MSVDHTPEHHLHAVPPPYDDQEPPYDPEYDTPPPAAARPTPGTPSHNLAAEQAVIGAMLINPDVIPDVTAIVEPADYYRPQHEQIHDAIVDLHHSGRPVDMVTVAQELIRRGQLAKIGGPYLHTCYQATHTASNADYYATIVRDHARLRAADNVATRIHQIVREARPDQVDRVLGEALQIIETADLRSIPGATTHVHIPNIDELLAGNDDDTYDWVIPGIIEHQERVILTAEEGAGKSTLLRQFAIQAAAGIHPFTGEQITPQRVLHIDVENTLRQSRRLYRPLRIQADDLLDPQRLHIELRTAGIDLTTSDDRDWLLNVTRALRPDLLLIGPIYKLANGDPTEEKSAKPVAMAIDAVREQTDTAVILEAHAAKAPSGQKKRPHEPYGWSGWLRWPEVGLWLDRDGKLSHWRGAREERAWPEKLERGGDWPWSPALSETAGMWNQIRIAREAHATPMSMRQLEEATGLSKSTIARLIGGNGPYAYGWRLINQAKATPGTTAPADGPDDLPPGWVDKTTGEIR